MVKSGDRKCCLLLSTLFKSAFTRQKNWFRTRLNSGRDPIVLAVYTKNILLRGGKKCSKSKDQN